MAEKRAAELENLICKIYEDNALGKLPDARYAAFDAQYAKEQGELADEITKLEKAIGGFEQSQKSASKFIALIEKYENFDTMTNTMLNEFVEKTLILVHERDRKGAKIPHRRLKFTLILWAVTYRPIWARLPLPPRNRRNYARKRNARTGCIRTTCAARQYVISLLLCI